MLVAVLGIALPAAAGPLGDALSRHADADIAALRGQLADPTARCTLGAAYELRGDLPRAALYLDGCDAMTPDVEIAPAIARAAAEVQRKLRASELSALSIVTNPPGLVVETDALPGERITTPATVWVKAGTYTVRAEQDGKIFESSVKIGARSRGSIVLEAPVVKTVAPKDGVANFNDEPTDPPQSGPPPAVKHPSLLPCKYDGCETHAGEQLADPLELERECLPPHPEAWRIGVRAGVDAADHDGGSRIGPSFAAVTHVEAPWEDAEATHPFELELRVDWSQRGGNDAKFDAVGTSIGLDRVFAAPDAAWILAEFSIRGDTRFGDVMGLERFGLSGSESIELALRKIPVVVATRFEYGITALMPGVREHAFIVELGVDWRAFRFKRR